MNKDKKTKIKKQLISGGVYIVLAAAIVGVTTGTVSKMFSDSKENLPDLPDMSDTKFNSQYDIKLPEIYGINSQNEDTQVSGEERGVNAQIVPGDEMFEPVNNDEKAEETVKEETVAEDFGYPGFVVPCDGFVTKEFSEDVLVYSPTMSDFRVHLGVDFAAEPAQQVKAATGGKVKEIFDHAMYGKTITIESEGGLEISYSNLLENVAKGIEVGSIVKTGDVIGGVGNTALCETAEGSHLHLEAKRGGEYIDPLSLFDEYMKNEAQKALESKEID